MNKFKEGTKVLFVDNENKLTEGVIAMALDFSDSVIIESDGVRYKRLYSDIRVLEEKPDEPVKSEEPKKVRVTDKPVITISREQFTITGASLCADTHMRKGAEEAVKVAEIVAKLTAILFTEVNCD